MEREVEALQVNDTRAHLVGFKWLGLENFNERPMCDFVQGILVCIYMIPTNFFEAKIIEFYPFNFNFESSKIDLAIQQIKGFSRF